MLSHVFFLSENRQFHNSVGISELPIAQTLLLFFRKWRNSDLGFRNYLLHRHYFCFFEKGVIPSGITELRKYRKTSKEFNRVCGKVGLNVLSTLAE